MLLLRDGYTPSYQRCAGVLVLLEGTSSGTNPTLPQTGDIDKDSKSGFLVSASAIGFRGSAPWERVTSDEYERLYANALDVLRGKISKVGDPETGSDGVRIASVGGILCDDEFVFRLAWDKETAQVLVARGWTPLR
jgi:hypothetical protein